VRWQRAHGPLTLVAASAARQSEKFMSPTGKLSSLHRCVGASRQAMHVFGCKARLDAVPEMRSYWLGLSRQTNMARMGLHSRSELRKLGQVDRREDVLLHRCYAEATDSIRWLTH